MIPGRFKRSHHGAILINVLVFIVIISILLAGMGQLMVSDYSIVKVENNYANSLLVAEAGINYEIRKITVNASTGDQKKTGSTPGTSYTTAAGTFSVYVTQRNTDGTETTPWTAGKNLWIYSTGGVNGLTRTVKVAATPYSSASSGNYAVFGITEGIINTSPTVVQGDVGTNGIFTFNGHPNIGGSVVFNGSSSNWQSPPNGTYTVVHNANAVAWPTVETIAVNTFGSQGLNYVASNNDNALASPTISNPNLTANSNQTFVGKAGGANYYLTNLTLNGSSQIFFNNSAGPITIWIGPSGGSCTVNINAGTATVKQTNDPSKPVRMYVATNNDVQINGNVELDAGIYNINNGNQGRVIFNGSASIYGMILSNKFTFNSSPTVYNVQGYFVPTGTASSYGCTQPWMEVGGVN